MTTRTRLRWATFHVCHVASSRIFLRLRCDPSAADGLVSLLMILCKQAKQAVLEEQDWFFPDIDRAQAEALLSISAPGQFLVRRAISNPPNLALSVATGVGAKHFKIMLVPSSSCFTHCTQPPVVHKLQQTAPRLTEPMQQPSNRTSTDGSQPAGVASVPTRYFLSHRVSQPVCLAAETPADGGTSASQL